MRNPLPSFIRVWFALDLLIALLPPLHWMAAGATPVLGMPRVLVYLLGASAFVAASVVVAYLQDEDR